MMDHISFMGYRRYSPYRHYPFIDVYTPDGTISMEDVDIDLIGIDEEGNKKIMKAGNKNPYKFKGKVVREIPLGKYEMKKGGNPYKSRDEIIKRILISLLEDDPEDYKERVEGEDTVQQQLPVQKEEKTQIRNLIDMAKRAQREKDEEMDNLAMSMVIQYLGYDDWDSFTGKTKKKGNTPYSDITFPEKMYDVYKQFEGTPYKFSGDSKDGIDCSGYVCKVLGLPRTTSENILTGAPNFRMFSGDVSEIKEGTVIGFDTGKKSFDKGRRYGIDHVGVVVRNPDTGQLEYTDSSSGSGVKSMSIPEMLSKYKNARIYIGDYIY